MIRPMSENDARALLARGRVGRLGCISEGSPYVVPVSYILEGDSIYVHSLEGRKVRALRQNASACLQADEIHDVYNWRSVVVTGVYEELEDSDERQKVLADLLRKFPYLTPVESVPAHDGGSKVVVFRIRIAQIGGVFEQWHQA